MSYDRVNPTYYQTFQPNTPFHPGAEGWQTAPWVTWGENPNLAGRARLATDGLGAAPSCGCSGLGKVVAISGLGAPDAAPITLASTPSWVRTLAMIGAAASAYHGYKRNGSVGWAVGWAFFGSVAPVLALPIALAQGFGEPRSKRMTSNRRGARRR